MIGRDACGEFMSVSLPCRPLWVIEIVVLHFTFDLDGFCFEALLEEGQSRDIRWLWTQTNSWRRPALCFNCAFGCLYSSVSHRHTHTVCCRKIGLLWPSKFQATQSKWFSRIGTRYRKGFRKDNAHSRLPDKISGDAYPGFIPWKGPKSAILHCVRQEWFYEQ